VSPFREQAPQRPREPCVRVKGADERVPAAPIPRAIFAWRGALPPSLLSDMRRRAARTARRKIYRRVISADAARPCAFAAAHTQRCERASERKALYFMPCQFIYAAQRCDDYGATKISRRYFLRLSRHCFLITLEDMPYDADAPRAMLFIYAIQAAR